MILAVDAGNSRVKWGFCKAGLWIAEGAVSHPDIVRLGEAWKPYGAPHAIVVSNVAGEKVRSALGLLFGRFRMQPVWVSSASEQCGVRNRYENPAQLGADRWCALIGARHLQSGPVVIVNVGTAMPVDALSHEGEFLGGLILPGVRLMLEVLSAKTAHIRVDQGEFKSFPTNTRDAVYSGALQALLGAIDRVRALLARESGVEPALLLSGGGASVLEPHLAMPVKRVDNLVLIGLAQIGESL
jgi:type III pantothenate kinase